MSNGCGCEKGLLKCVKPPYASFFFTACLCHDDDYDKGGDSKQRKQADKDLYWRMVELVKKRGASFSPLKATWMIVTALMYYFSVRLFGWLYFNKNK